MRTLAYVRDGDEFRHRDAYPGIAVRLGRLWAGELEACDAVWAPDFPSIQAAYAAAGRSIDQRPRLAHPLEIARQHELPTLPSIREATILAHGRHLRDELGAWQPRGTTIAINHAAHIVACDWWVALDGFYRLGTPLGDPLRITSRRAADSVGIRPWYAVEQAGLDVQWSVWRALDLAVLAGAATVWIVGDDRLPGTGQDGLGGAWLPSHLEAMGTDVDRAIGRHRAAGIRVVRVRWTDFALHLDAGDQTPTDPTAAPRRRQRKAAQI
jgi:hypothetical protein